MTVLRTNPVTDHMTNQFHDNHYHSGDPIPIYQIKTTDHIQLVSQPYSSVPDNLKPNQPTQGDIKIFQSRQILGIFLVCSAVNYA